MTDKLKPCPFCEQPAELMAYALPTEYYQVVCTGCRARLDGINQSGKEHAKSNAKTAIESWNKRQPVGNPDTLNHNM